MNIVSVCAATTEADGVSSPPQAYAMENSTISIVLFDGKLQNKNHIFIVMHKSMTYDLVWYPKFVLIFASADDQIRRKFKNTVPISNDIHLR